jgi:hypothetical protein
MGCRTAERGGADRMGTPGSAPWPERGYSNSAVSLPIALDPREIEDRCLDGDWWVPLYNPGLLPTAGADATILHVNFRGNAAVLQKDILPGCVRAAPDSRHLGHCTTHNEAQFGDDAEFLTAEYAAASRGFGQQESSSRSARAPVPAQDLSPGREHLSRILMDLRSHPRPVKLLQMLFTARLKRLASAVQLRPWPPCFQSLIKV